MMGITQLSKPTITRNEKEHQSFFEKPPMELIHLFVINGNNREGTEHTD
jgi:hypothetical protein